MNKTKTDKVVDAIFLISLALVVISLTINIAFSGKSTEAAHEPPTFATAAETTEYITEPTQAETLATEVTVPTEEVTEPSVTLYDVPLDYDLQLHIISEAAKHGIDPAIIMAMAKKESNYRENAIGDNGSSYGLLQIQPKWHKKRMEKLGCTDLLDPYQNVTVGVDYLAEQIDRYGSLAKGLTAYNKGHYAGTVTKYAKSVIAIAEKLG
jgi:soluble lytic murein transglycosylase-like protein